MKRPPVVVVMGHVDHGKTTFLDYVRKTNVAEKEAGGITQSIGAYEIEYKGNKITFIDTPGHQAFTNMRQYGARVADIAILIVAADDGVKPQTKEAIQIIKEANISFIVAINKIDRLNADPERVRKELLEAGVLLEKYGGNVSWEEISAKTGQGIDNVLDLILLAAELENLSYSLDNTASGVIIKSVKDPKRGVVVSGILKDGKIKVGQKIATPSAEGKIKMLYNFLGEKVEEAYPSAPLEIIGFEDLPKVGEEFFADENLNPAIVKKENNIMLMDKEDEEEKDEDVLKIILKAEEYSSLEALEKVLFSAVQSSDIRFKIIAKSVGHITENDVKQALTFKAVIIGFRTKVDKAASILAKSNNVTIVVSDIVYELEKILKEMMKGSSTREQRSLEILKVFSIKGKEQIVGGVVVLGPVKNQESFSILRGGKEVGTGRILNLQSQKQDVKEVESGKEAGLLVEGDVEIKEGDILVFE